MEGMFTSVASSVRDMVMDTAILIITIITTAIAIAMVTAIITMITTSTITISTNTRRAMHTITIMHTTMTKRVVTASLKRAKFTSPQGRTSTSKLPICTF